MIGKIYSTKNYGSIEIIGNGVKHNYFKVRFLETNHIDEFRKDAIRKGEIRDKYAITLCGVGIIGDIKTRGKYKPYYTIWRNIITRCYTNYNKAYYGKVTICDRWKTFENFYQDCCKIDGWDLELFNCGKLELDKDIKQRFMNKKVYSIETCKWVSKFENSQIQDGQQRRFIAIDTNGNTYTDYNISKFAREHGFERRQISAVLHGRYKTSLGWKFKYIDEDIV